MSDPRRVDDDPLPARDRLPREPPLPGGGLRRSRRRPSNHRNIQSRAQDRLPRSPTTGTAAWPAEFGVKTVPEAFVLDDEGRLRYRGRIDGQVPARDRRSLVRPVRACAARSRPSSPIGRCRQPYLEPVGCPPPEITLAQEDRMVADTTTVTWLPILRRSCQPCHQPGQSGPFPLTYLHAGRETGRRPGGRHRAAVDAPLETGARGRPPPQARSNAARLGDPDPPGMGGRRRSRRAARHGSPTREPSRPRNGPSARPTWSWRWTSPFRCRRLVTTCTAVSSCRRPSRRIDS